MEGHTVLIVDDDPRIRSVLKDALSHWGYRVTTASSGGEALNLLESALFDAALVDIRMPEMDGLELLGAIKRHDPALEVVIMTGYPTVSTAVNALKEGAYDYLTKPLMLEDLRHLLKRVVERLLLRREVNSLRRQLGDELLYKELVGTSAEIQRVKELVAKVAPTDSAVLVEGESGTGKGLVAAAIHQLSGRSKGPFLPVNCAAIPGDLLDSELFGHLRGAFSGAVTDSMGLFRSAEAGTVFLDEIAELPTALQAKLLRVVEDKEVRPVGSAKTHTVDVRIIAATNRQLDEAVKAGTFRQDLFHRLNVIRISIPPLREHKTDIPALVTHFLRQFNRRFGGDVKAVAPEAMSALFAYDFPGNVRELEHLLERAYVLGAQGEITLTDLPALQPRLEASAQPREVQSLAQVQRELILRTLHRHGNNRKRAAQALGLSRRTIYRRLKEYGLL